ncbi:arginine deiminase [Hartmannibacter diazotrophicus]|uniref:arginine deiminase n=1 Tax=Hartmannibacter diazotrophicus TaxID=1482074 RepID=A0A2C9DBA1_9HYPH|nr:arginine deiminase family protein [Hartmannibacter diazotrophicus]SON57449.1 arginine deiminase [Hartmannibacter diazotrophicus]
MSAPAPEWQIDSETGVLRDVLLCPPDHYEWITTNDIARRSLTASGGASPDHQGLQAQFRELTDCLEGAGVACHYLEPEPQLPYQVYTRDSSQVTPWGPFATQLFRPQRRGEIASIAAFYEKTGCPIRRFPSAGSVEGGDIHIIRPGLMAIGYSGERTTQSGAEQFAGWFEAEGWSTRIISFAEHFLHLDVIFSMVADGLALAVTDVIDDEHLDWFKANGIRLLPVSYKEAMGQMGCNVLALGNDRVVSPRHSRRVNEMMRAEGLTVLEPELDLFASGGGSVHCMTMPLKRDLMAK